MGFKFKSELGHRPITKGIMGFKKYSWELPEGSMTCYRALGLLGADVYRVDWSLMSHHEANGKTHKDTIRTLWLYKLITLKYGD